MSLEGNYDPDNVFAKILRGELSAARVYEDEAVCAFMDAFPQAEGHVLVVTKGLGARNLLDCPPETLTAMIQTAQRIGQAIVAALRPDGLVLMQFNGSSAGQTVFHPHIHLIPRREGQALRPHGADGMADMASLNDIADTIASHGEGDGFVRRE